MHGKAITDPKANLPLNRFNGGVTDPKGRLRPVAMKEGLPIERKGRFYCLDPGRSCVSLFNSVFRSNELALSPNGRVMRNFDSNPSARTIPSSDCDTYAGIPGEPRVPFGTRAVKGGRSREHTWIAICSTSVDGTMHRHERARKHGARRIL